eukprot:gene6227-6701_t
MFQAGEKQFPKAMTMLEATAEANNRNAYDLAIKSYLDAMVALLGGKDNSDAYMILYNVIKKRANLLCKKSNNFRKLWIGTILSLTQGVNGDTLPKIKHGYFPLLKALSIWQSDVFNFSAENLSPVLIKPPVS